MTGDQPLSFMFKPPAEHARAFDLRRTLLGIRSRYGWQRLHMTALPLGEGRDVSDARLARFDQVVRALDLQPFRLEFTRLNGNMLIASKGAAEVREFRRRASALLGALGEPPASYRSTPHLTLDYGKPPNRSERIAPIGYPVDSLLLVRSIHGEGRHEELARWVFDPRQGSFGF